MLYQQKHVNINNSISFSVSLYHMSHDQQGKTEGFDSCDQPRNLTQIGFKSSIFLPVSLWNLMGDLKNNRAPLLYYIKLCASFHSHWWIQDQKRPPKYLELMLSNMLRPTFVPNVVVLTLSKSIGCLRLINPTIINQNHPTWPTPTPYLHPHPPSNLKPNSTARSDRFSSGTPCVTLWNSLCSIPVTWVSTHNY